MHKFLLQRSTVLEASKKAMELKVPAARLCYDDSVFQSIIEKLKLRETYPRSSESLNIIDFNVKISPFSQHLNTTLQPKHHLIFPDGLTCYKFWKRMETEDSSLSNITVSSPAIAKTAKANILTEPLKEGWINPQFENDPTKINQTLLFVADFTLPSTATAFRNCLYYNEVGTSMFRYNGVKFLTWTKPHEILKYIGPLGTIHRRTNSLMANLYSDIKVIAYSNNDKIVKIDDIFGRYDPLKLPESKIEGDICLVEFQSNYAKYDIKFPEELHFIIHKLLCSPGNILKHKLHVLGPDGEAYFSKELPEDLLNKKMSFIENEEFIKISEIYYYWPFKPNIQLESYMTNDTSRVDE